LETRRELLFNFGIRDKVPLAFLNPDEEEKEEEKEVLQQ